MLFSQKSFIFDVYNLFKSAELSITPDFTEYAALSSMGRYVSVLCVNQQALFFVLMVRRLDMDMDDCLKKKYRQALSSKG